MAFEGELQPSPIEASLGAEHASRFYAVGFFRYSRQHDSM